MGTLKRNDMYKVLAWDSVKTIGWGIAVFLGGCLFWYVLVGNPFRELALIQHGETVSGFIIDADEEPPERREGKMRWSYDATYKYRLPDGREFTGKTDGSGRLPQDLRFPYPIEVEYLPNNPTVSRIKGTGQDSIQSWLLLKVGLGSLLLAACVAPGFILIRNGVRELKSLPQWFSRKRR